jgi:hypothetical protein
VRRGARTDCWPVHPSSFLFLCLRVIGEAQHQTLWSRRRSQRLSLIVTLASPAHPCRRASHRLTQINSPSKTWLGHRYPPSSAISTSSRGLQLCRLAMAFTTSQCLRENRRHVSCSHHQNSSQWVSRSYVAARYRSAAKRFSHLILGACQSPPQMFEHRARRVAGSR